MEIRGEKLLTHRIYYNLVKNGFTNYMLQPLSFNEEQYSYEFFIVPFSSQEAAEEYRATLNNQEQYLLGEIEEVADMADGISGIIFYYREVGLYG